MDLPIIAFGDLQNNVLHRQLNLSVEIDFSFAFLFYHHGGQAQELMRQFKYLKRPQVGVYFGLWMARLLHTYGLTESFDLIVPVPLSPKKKRQRGFNQAEVLARQIAQIAQVPLEVNWLKRKTASVRQVDRNREDRFNDLERLYYLHDDQKYRNKRILLVDDVITTGSTVRICVKKLSVHGLNSVAVAALAMTP